MPPTLPSAMPPDAREIDRLLEDNLAGLRAFLRVRAGAAVRARCSNSDLVQSVCREVLEGVGNFEYRGDSAFKLWLFQTARRKIIDRARYWRRDKRAVGKEVPLDPHPKKNQSSGNNLLQEYATFCTPSQEAIRGRA